MSKSKWIAVVAGTCVAMAGGKVGWSNAAAGPWLSPGVPENGQVVQPDLSDPGLDGALTLRVTVPPRMRRFLRDPRGAFDDSDRLVTLLDNRMMAVPFTHRYQARTHLLRLFPTLPLLEAQYTLALRMSSPQGGNRWRNRLDAAGQVFRTSFTVGPDVFAPVVRELTPAPNQWETPRATPVTLVFNESLNPATAVLGRTVFVEDAGTSPPVPVEGNLAMRNDGFEVTFYPAPYAGLPPATTIRVRLLAAGNPDAVTDRAGNALEGDPGTGEFSWEFHTKGP